MIPRRLRILRPYLASFIHQRFDRPPLSEVTHWLTQASKQKRASRYIDKKRENGEFSEIYFSGFTAPFFYPRNANWTDFCQTVDEVFNPNNWHHFISDNTDIGSGDTVVDCGAAEGLFSFFAAKHAKKVFAVEPIPMWHASLDKTFQALSNVEVIKAGVGHHNAQMRMTDDEIYSRVCATGKQLVPIYTLDSIFAGNSSHISFIKADIEGLEYLMLLGAEGLIRKNRPKIAVAMYHGSNHFAEVQEFLLNIHSEYRFKLRGIAENGNPVLLQAF